MPSGDRRRAASGNGDGNANASASTSASASASANAAGPGAARRSPARRTLTPAWVLFLVAAAVAVLGLASLGVWQLQRLAWKQALVAATDERVHLDPVAAPAADQWADVAGRPDHYRYRRVWLSGRWQTGQDTWVQATTALGSGFWLMTPLARDDGTIVLVNRGFVTRRQPLPTTAPSTAPPTAVVGAEGASPPVTVTGLLRTSEGQGIYPRRNDPRADRWFSRDVAAIADRRGLAGVAPYFVDDQGPAAASPAAGRPPTVPVEPVPGLTVVQFRNHHLGYALTWFVLAAMTAAAAWRVWRWHREEAGASRPPGVRREDDAERRG